LQETAGKLKSLRVQRAIKLCKRIKIRQDITVLQSSLKCVCQWTPIAVKLFIRKISFFFSARIEGILRFFTNFYLHREFSLFLRNDRDCKAVEGLDIFEKLS
jgi:hypothetical protein